MAPEQACARAYRYHQGFSHLVLMCGPSGAGKSRWVAEHLPGYRVISLDGLREQYNGQRASQINRGKILQQAKNQLRQALAARQPVVWDATNLRRDFRLAIVQLGLKYQALVTTVVFHKSLHSLATGNRQRCEAVPASVFDSQLQSLQWPTADESHQLIVIGGDGKRLCEGVDLQGLAS